MIPDLKRFLLMIVLTLAFAPLSVAQDEAANEEQAEERAQEEKAPGVTDYIAMNPPFVTHVGEPGPSLTYLKAAVTLRASSASTRPVVETHMPRLRHELVMLFGQQTDLDLLASQTGQAALREEAKKRINQVLAEQQTDESIANVLFTEFVVQR
jgi:flagellar FliL protein